MKQLPAFKAASLEHPAHGGPLGPTEWDAMEASTPPPFLSNELDNYLNWELDKIPRERKNDKYSATAQFMLQECLWKRCDRLALCRGLDRPASSAGSRR